MLTTGELFAGRYRVGEQRPDVAFVDSFEALDEKLHRRVVVTTVKDRFATNLAFVEKFAQSARAALSLHHPAIARTYDVGTLATTGQVYMVTESLTGQTLHALLKSGALDAQTAATYLRQVALGLEYARSHDALHLGLSPKNIWITSGNKAVLSGITTSSLVARMAPTSDFLASALGTSGYLAPEQILFPGTDAATTESVDVYALGLILSEALCARPTWDKKLAGDQLTARASTRPILPGTVNSTVPPEIDDLIFASTQPQVGERNVTLISFANALESFVTPTSEVPETSPGMSLASTITPVSETLVLPSAADTSAGAASPGVSPELARVFPSASLSTKEFTLEEFTAGRNTRGFVALLSTMVGVVVAIAVAILVVVSLMPANVVPETSRAVPGVVGQTYDDAAKQIESVGLVPVRSDETSSTVAAGNVISVTPSVGTKVEIGTKITVHVSSGSESGTVPNLVGMSSRAAENYLVKAGFVIGTVTEVDRGSVPKGNIISTSPAAGETAAAGSKINLIKASGNVKIPDLVDKTMAEATAILTGPDIGITPSLTANANCAASSPVKVRSQSAGPGVVPSTTKITLTYCTG